MNVMPPLARMNRCNLGLYYCVSKKNLQNQILKRQAYFEAFNDFDKWYHWFPTETDFGPRPDDVFSVRIIETNESDDVQPIFGDRTLLWRKKDEMA